MTQKIDMSIFTAIIELMYEPEIQEGSPAVGDYGGHSIDRRIVIRRPDEKDPYIDGFELFTTKINETEYVGLFRTWYDEYGGITGNVVSLLNQNKPDGDSPAARIMRAVDLFRWIRSVISLFETDEA